MSKQKNVETKQEDLVVETKEDTANVDADDSLQLDRTIPVDPLKRELYAVVVVNFSRKEEITPIMLTMASNAAEAQSIIHQRLAEPWKTENLKFHVNLF